MSIASQQSYICDECGASAVVSSGIPHGWVIINGTIDVGQPLTDPTQITATRVIDKMSCLSAFINRIATDVSAAGATAA